MAETVGPGYHIKEIETDSPKVKNAPKTNSLPTPFAYFPSDDGTDENLLILLHGLGAFSTPILVTTP